MAPEAKESRGLEAPAPQRRRGAGRERDTPHALASEIFLQCQYGRTPAAPRAAHGHAAAGAAGGARGWARPGSGFGPAPPPRPTHAPSPPRPPPPSPYPL